jgi:hypothetical protein
MALLLAIGSATRQDQAQAQLVVPPSHDTDTKNRDADTDADDEARPMHKKACKASDLIGMEVRTAGGDEAVGSINDLLIRHDGRIEYAAVSFGGFLGMGDKLFAVPFEAIEFMKIGEGDAADTFARIDVNEQTLRDRKGFDQDNWPDEADRAFLTGSRQVGQRPGSDLSR